MRRRFGLALSFAFACAGPSSGDSAAKPDSSAFAAEPPRTVPPAVATPDTARFSYGWCVPQAEATLAGLGTHSDTAQVRALGPVLAREVGSGEDDGGVYTTSILHFRGLSVTIDDRGWGIKRVETADSTLLTLARVHVGMSLDAAFEAWGVPAGSRELEKHSAEPRWDGNVCSNSTVPLMPSDLASVSLYINASRVITRIAFTNYGP